MRTGAGIVRRIRGIELAVVYHVPRAKRGALPLSRPELELPRIPVAETGTGAP